MKNKITRVELISKQNGREKVIKTDDIELSFQDDGRTLKILYGYGKLDDLKHFTEKEIKCTGNNGNGCYMDSCGHNCGCEGITK